MSGRIGVADIAFMSIKRLSSLRNDAIRGEAKISYITINIFSYGIQIKIIFLDCGLIKIAQFELTYMAFNIA